MNIAVILTGGNGTRMGSSLPKQFIEVNDKPVFIYTIEAFINNKNINRVVLTINKDYQKEYADYLAKFNLQEKVELCLGGKTRQESTYLSLLYLVKNSSLNDIILIHDGARPLVNDQIINENIKLCKENHCPVSTVINIVDTIVSKDYDLLDRNNLLIVQTPQTFVLEQILSMHKKAINQNLNNISDDAQLAKRFNLSVKYALGSRFNIKVTTPEDLKILELFLRK